MTSTLKADTLQASTTNGSVTLKGDGTGSVLLPSGIAYSANVTGNASVTRSLAVGYTDGRVPQANLEVKGNTHITGLTTFASTIKILGGSPGADKVLTSDADGDASWETAGGGGAWNLIGTAIASDSASLTITGLDSTYDTYAIAVADLVPANDSVNINFRVGDSSGIDSGTNDYDYHTQRSTSAGNSNAYNAVANEDVDIIEISTTQCGSAAGEGYGGLFYLHRPGDGTMQPNISGTYSAIGVSTELFGGVIMGKRNAVITLDRIQVYCASGNIATGRVTVWGIAHA